MSSTSNKRSRGIRVLGLAFAVLLVLLCIAAFVAWRFQGTPDHWKREQARLADLSDAQQQATSQSFRNQFITLWGNPGDKTPATEADLFGHRQEIKVPYTELNTWIKAEGVAMLTEFGVKVPKSASALMVDSPGDDLLRVSFEILYKGAPQIISLSFDLSIASDGTLTSTLKQATAGKMPLPVGTAIDLSVSLGPDLGLPPNLATAVIVHKGMLTPGYRHLQTNLDGARLEG